MWSVHGGDMWCEEGGGEETMSMENGSQRSMQAEREKEPRRGKDGGEAERRARKQGQEKGQ